jgi:hypothetical protein
MKDTIDMAREAGIKNDCDGIWCDADQLKAFEALVRADEREACANLVFHSPPSDEYESPLKAVYEAIRARSGEQK